MTGLSSARADAAIESLFARLGRLRIDDPVRVALTQHRIEAARATADRYRDRAEALQAAVMAREPDAVSAFDALCADALAEMRAARPSGAAALLGALDRWFYSNDEEMLDDPRVPQATRVRVLEVLDRFNLHVGSYAVWSRLVEPLVERAHTRGARPAEIVELAAGHGNFAVHLADHFGGSARVAATDLRSEYLDIGRARGERSGVSYFVQDATHLTPLQARGVDVFVCTQSLHHFSPGMVARMISEAARVARAGACFIDGERGLLPLAIVAPLLLVYGRSWALFHDAVVSLRRMYYEEELALCGALAPGLGASGGSDAPRVRIETGRIAPGFAFLRAWAP